MPQFDVTTLVSQLFWVFVTFTFLFVAMSRVVLPRITSILEERQDRIDNDMDKALELRREAEDVMGQYNDALGKARTTARTLIEEMRVSMQETVQERQSELAAKLAQDALKAEKRIQTAKEKAMDNIKSVAIEASANAFSTLSGEKLDTKHATSAVEKVTTRSNKQAA